MRKLNTTYMLYILINMCLGMHITTAVDTSLWTNYKKAYDSYKEKKTSVRANVLWKSYEKLMGSSTYTYSPSIFDKEHLVDLYLLHKKAIKEGTRQKKEKAAFGWQQKAREQMKEFRHDSIFLAKFCPEMAVRLNELEAHNKRLARQVKDLTAKIKKNEARAKR